jgi:hypothetical protein
MQDMKKFKTAVNKIIKGKGMSQTFFVGPQGLATRDVFCKMEIEDLDKVYETDKAGLMALSKCQNVLGHLPQHADPRGQWPGHELPETTWSIEPGKKSLKWLLSAVSTDRENIQGLAIQQGQLQATDGHRLHCLNVAIDAPDLSAVNLDTTVLKSLAPEYLAFGQVNDRKCLVLDNWVFFEGKGKYTFPDTSVLFPRVEVDHFNLDQKIRKEARVLVAEYKTAKKNEGASDPKIIMNYNPETDSMSLFSDKYEGTAHVVKSPGAEVHGQPLRVGLNPKYLHEGLTYMTDDNSLETLPDINSVRPLIFISGKMTAMIMPKRLD